jgi:uncharacterized protein YyaL (SSP411 family)
MACALLYEVHGIPEIAVVGNRAHEMAEAIHRSFLPQKVLMSAAMEPDESFPLLEGKQNGGDTLVYLCRNYACQRPVKTIEDFRKLIEKFRN